MRELTLPGRLILLPGLGSTSDVFSHQRKAFGDRLETPDFIPHQPNESVAAYAKRWAKQFSKPGEEGPLFVGGVSFGGMLAQEMAMHLEPKPRAVLLIASSRTGDTVTPLMQFAELVGRLVPEESVNKSMSVLKFAFAMLDGLDDDDKGRLYHAAQKVDRGMTKWASGAAVGWPGFEPPEGYPPIHMIHARKDWVLTPPAEDTPNVQWVDGHSHLLHMTNAQTVNRFIFETIMRYCPEADVDFPGIEDPHTTAQRRATLEGKPAGTPLV